MGNSPSPTTNKNACYLIQRPCLLLCAANHGLIAFNLVSLDACKDPAPSHGAMLSSMSIVSTPPRPCWGTARANDPGADTLIPLLLGPPPGSSNFKMPPLAGMGFLLDF